MVRRLIGLCAGALLAGCGGGSHSTPPVGAVNPGSPDAKKVAVSFSVIVPARRQSAHNRHLEYVSSATKSASFAVAAGNATPTPADTVTVNCTTACSGTVLASIGSDTFVAKLYDGVGGGGAVLSTGTTKQTITAGTNSVQLTFNPVVASVALSLDPPNLPADAAPPANTALLNIIAKDASKAIIVGPGSYVDANGQPLKITIASSPIPNTKISPTPTEFTAPQPANGATNVATVIYTKPDRFQFPTFTVANQGLPSDPQAGVTLLYELVAAEGLDLNPCTLPPSVGGEYFAVGCGIGDIGTDSSGNLQTLNVHTVHDGVTLGFGSDKQVYFAYAPPASPAPTTIVFGKLDVGNPLASPTSSPVPFSTLKGLPAFVGTTNGLTLGNDGALWFSGTATDGSGIIGRLPPGPVLAPKWFPIPNSRPSPPPGSAPPPPPVLSFGPGLLRNTETLLYTHYTGSASTVHIATINTDLLAFTEDREVTSSQPLPFTSTDTAVEVGDILTATDGSVLVSATKLNNSDPSDLLRFGSIYRIVNGTLSLWSPPIPCKQSDTGQVDWKVYRLPDGTGVGLSSRQECKEEDGGVCFAGFLHVVPGQGCTVVPVVGELEANAEGQFWIDVTADSSVFYGGPTQGHRRGIF